MNNGRDCEHGRRAGNCDSCDLVEAEKRIAELEVERDALSATVNTLEMAIMSNCYDDPSTSGKRLIELANATPQQHLAEIRAEAVKEFVAFLPTYSYGINAELEKEANKYAAKVRQGGAE